MHEFGCITFPVRRTANATDRSRAARRRTPPPQVLYREDTLFDDSDADSLPGKRRRPYPGWSTADNRNVEGEWASK
jgi:hypothetical protein